MYHYIKGIVEGIYSDFIVLDNQGMGYKIITPNPFSFKQGEFYIVHVYQHVREDLIALFGFKTEQEKDLFLKLLSVKGIGPKSALAILAYSSNESIITAIETENVTLLKKFPGIGPKAAQQIVLDLKGKLVSSENIIIRPEFQEVEEALEVLGYKRADINKVMKKLERESGTTDVLIKKALQLLLK